MTAKWLWIIADPNGTGKAMHTNKLIDGLQASGVLGSEIIKLNADERTAELRKQFTDRPLQELNLQAAQETDAALVAWETVVSGERNRAGTGCTVL